VDGVPFGKPLLRQLAHRPEIHIPPRKRARLTMPEDEDDDEGFAALMDTEEGDTVDDDTGKQLVLHADFDDDDSENDEDFAPAADGDDEDEDEEDFAPEEDESSDEDLSEKEASDDDSGPEPVMPEELNAGLAREDTNEEALEGVDDEAVRAQIRKLQSAFPDSTLDVCRHVYDGAHGDMVVSWEALSQGFKSAKPKSSFAKTLQEVASPSTSQAKSRKRSAAELESEDDEDEEEDESQDPFLKHYDENGFPPGSISSGKALSVMAEVVKGSPDRRPQSKPSSTTSKRIKFPLDEELSKGLTSTPLLDKESDKEESEDDSDGSSDDTSSSGSSDSSSDEESDKGADQNDDTSSSGSDSDTDSSDSESDADVPTAAEVIASKFAKANLEVDDTSSESESESDSGSQKAVDKMISKSDQSDVEDQDTSSSESESESATSSDSSSDDDSPEEVTSKLATALSSATKKSPSKPTVKPFQGLNSTKKRNQRRQVANKLQRFKDKGILPAGTTLEEFKRIQLKEDSTLEEASAALSAARIEILAEEAERSNGQALAKTDEFERRKQQLLASLASGGVEVDQPSRPSPPAEASQPPATELISAKASKEPHVDQDEAKVLSTAPETLEQKPADARKDIVTQEARPSTAPEAADNPSQTAKPQPTSVDSSQAKATRRPKIDLGAATRMLFGNLGKRAPKSKEDADKLKKDMMKDIKPTWVPKPAEEPVADASESDNDDSWREKIIYRAVECCHDGIELSEPPFPFEQRWDPQQKPQSMKRLRNQSQYYDDSQPLSKKQRKRMRKNQDLEASYNSSFQDDSINTHDDSQMTAVQNDEEGEIDQQLLNDLNAPNADASQGPDDLVALPEDPSTLPQLEDGKAQIGMTIAFKQLTFSAETNWQPVMSPYQTAIVVMIAENGALDLRLAVRDRAQKLYDEETGERIYGKYDMPVDDEEEDDGRLELSFAELVEPKIVAPPPANTEQDSFMDEASPIKDGPSADESVTLSHEREEETAEAQFSHVTETLLNSDAPEAPEDSIEEIVSEEVAQSIEEPKGKGPATVPTTPLNADVMETEGVRTIKKIFKDEGFHSSVPRVVLDDLRPNGLKPPGDQAVFDKLRRDMEAVEGYSSPQFNGFGTSPSRERQERSNSPNESQNLPSALGSSPPKQSERPTTPEPHEPSQQAPSSSPQPPPSSWQTVDSQEDILTQSEKPVENTSSWVTVPNTASSPQPEAEQTPEPEDKVPTPQPTPKKAATPRKSPAKAPTPRQTPKKAPSPKPAAPAPGPAKPKSIKKVPRRTLGTAQRLWEQFQPQKSASPAVESRQESPDPFGLDGLDERDSNKSVEYPKLSLGSSFSQVSDHGRQPDYNFDDSATTHVDTPKVPGLDVDEGAATDMEPELPSHKSNEEGLNLDQPNDSIVMEPELPTIKPAATAPKDSSDDDSDSSLPSLDVVFSQQSIKKEKTPVRSKAPTKAKTMEVLDESSDEDTTPKPSQKQRQASQHQSRQSRPSQGASQARPSQRASQPSASQPRASQPRVTPSQMVDLTLSSSDVEPESEKETEFKSYEMNDDDGGWAAKNKNGVKHGSAGLRDSSQSSNKNRRKTVAR